METYRPRKCKYSLQIIAAFLSILFLASCTQKTKLLQHSRAPLGAYEISYSAVTQTMNIKSIDVTPPTAGQNITDKASLFQLGNAIFDGSLVTASVYIINNDTVPWTGVEMQAYNIVSGSPIAAETDLGTGWYIDSPSYGAWGWLFTSGRAGSTYTISAGGQSANKLIGFDATSSFVAWVYIYADVPVISSITPTTAWSGATVTISGYNFGSTLSQVTFSGTTATVWTWTNSAVTVTMPTVSGENVTGNVIVNTIDTNTPYSNPITFTANKTNTYAVDASLNGIAINSAGDVWVGNYGGNTVTELSPTGTTIGTYSVGVNPIGIAIDNAGDVWVANYGSNYVTELSPTGATIGTPSVNYGSVGIAIDSAGNVWVTNLNGVTELSPAGGATIGTYAVGANPHGIAIDSAGDVWVANFGSNNVTELSPTGVTIGTYAVGTNPIGLAIDSAGDVWVANLFGGTLTELVGITIGPQFFPCLGVGCPVFQGGGNL